MPQILIRYNLNSVFIKSLNKLSRLFLKSLACNFDEPWTLFRTKLKVTVLNNLLKFIFSPCEPFINIKILTNSDFYLSSCWNVFLPSSRYLWARLVRKKFYISIKMSISLHNHFVHFILCTTYVDGSIFPLYSRFGFASLREQTLISHALWRNLKRILIYGDFILLRVLPLFVFLKC